MDSGEDVDPEFFAEFARLRSDVAASLELQLVALASRPVSGIAGADNRARLREALTNGADLVGGAPWLDDDPREALDLLAGIASDAGVGLDLRVDEDVDPSIFTLPDVADLAETGFPHRITASHCVSLGSQAEHVQRAVAERLSGAGVGVVTLPGTNLFLQQRGVRQAPARGLTAISALREAGVALAAGADNLRDPFNATGAVDPLVTAGLLVHAGHDDLLAAVTAVSSGARAVTELDSRGLHGATGDAADFVALRVGSVGDALAELPIERITVHAGRVVSRTSAVVVWPNGPLARARQVPA